MLFSDGRVKRRCEVCNSPSRPHVADQRFVVATVGPRHDGERRSQRGGFGSGKGGPRHQR